MNRVAVARVAALLAVSIAAVHSEPVRGSPPSEIKQQAAGPERGPRLPLVDLHLKSASPGQALAALGQAAGVNLLAQLAASPAPRREVSISHTPFQGALGSLAASYGLVLTLQRKAGFVLVREQWLDLQQQIRARGTLTPGIVAGLSGLGAPERLLLARRLSDFPELPSLAQADVWAALRLWASLGDEQRARAASAGLPLEALTAEQRALWAALLEDSTHSPPDPRPGGLSVWLRAAGNKSGHDAAPRGEPALLQLRVALNPEGEDALVVCLPVRVSPQGPACCGCGAGKGRGSAGDGAVSVHVAATHPDAFRTRLRIAVTGARLDAVLAEISQAAPVTLTAASELSGGRRLVASAPEVSIRGMMSGLAALTGGRWERRKDRSAWHLRAPPAAQHAVSR